MTPDDEAFVRAVVDRPGDDLPRLVYADWLDERGDPRGPYLRAEAAWAATRDPDDRAALQRMAKGLDPVWMARVSRPPVGVCCDHQSFSGKRLKMTEPLLRSFEERCGVQLPAVYRAFLLNYNGGIPSLPATPASNSYQFVWLKQFLSISEVDDGQRDASLNAALREYRRNPPRSSEIEPITPQEQELFRRLIPIASLKDNIFRLLIVPATEKQAGRLVFYDCLVGAMPIGTYPIPDSLPALLEKLTTTESY